MFIFMDGHTQHYKTSGYQHYAKKIDGGMVVWWYSSTVVNLHSSGLD
jgi:hypothetical protein